ncbi:MAG: tRNA adenosine(34) deaminase TadA [Lachnospiraceae bacterium]|nr:tRNA adenosine(34) deaminase TadA [Lachnospiraceae bacterium]
MRKALAQARLAMRLGEVPIGCVIVRDGEIIGKGYNRRNTDRTSLAHAEMTAIRRANKSIGDWRLEDCTLYVTLEPCQMCAGAIIQARIPRVVIGADSDKAGCGGSIINILQNPEFMHQAQVVRGVMEEECSAMLKTFFRELRRRSREEKAGCAGAETSSDA